MKKFSTCGAQSSLSCSDSKPFTSGRHPHVLFVLDILYYSIYIYVYVPQVVFFTTKIFNIALISLVLFDVVPINSPGCNDSKYGRIYSRIVTRTFQGSIVTLHTTRFNVKIFYTLSFECICVIFTHFISSSYYFCIQL